MRLLRFHRHHVSDVELSTYLDSRLPARAQARVDAHLQACVDCISKLEEMRLLVTEMRRLPQATAPRSFAISPELAAVTRREAERSRQEEKTAARRVYLGFSGATAVAAILLVAVVGADLLASRGGEGSPTGRVASSREAEPAGAAKTDQAAEGIAGGDEDLTPGVAPSVPSAVPDSNKSLSKDAASTPDYAGASPTGEGTTTAQGARPSSEENSHVWLWAVEGAAAGLIIGFGVSAFWMRRRWVRIDRS